MCAWTENAIQPITHPCLPSYLVGNPENEPSAGESETRGAAVKVILRGNVYLGPGPGQKFCDTNADAEPEVAHFLVRDQTSFLSLSNSIKAPKCARV